jgi:hypothetical protein
MSLTIKHCSHDCTKSDVDALETHGYSGVSFYGTAVYGRMPITCACESAQGCAGLVGSWICSAVVPCAGDRPGHSGNRLLVSKDTS